MKQNALRENAQGKGENEMKKVKLGQLRGRPRLPVRGAWGRGYAVAGIMFMLTLLAFPVFAMQVNPPVTPTPAPVSTIATNIVVIAGIVASVLQGLKKMIPQINGNVAVALSVVASIAGAYAVAAPGQVMNIQFLITALGSALSANGIYSLMKKPQIEVNPGDTPIKKA